jgi:hypothetical protein
MTVRKKLGAGTLAEEPAGAWGEPACGGAALIGIVSGARKTFAPF